MAEGKENARHTLYRYSGGKSKVRHSIIDIINEVSNNTTKLVSPFLGGGSIEIEMAGSGVQVVAYDGYLPLASFWEVLQEGGNEQLATELERHMPLTSKEHYKEKLLMLESEDKFTRAVGFYICVKGAFSGKIGSSCEESRSNFQQAGVDKVRQWHNSNLSVAYGDCLETIPKHRDDFLYMDPPYYKTKSYYYGVNGSKHKNFPHEELGELLKNHRAGFVMSYDDSPEVRDIYEGWTEFRQLEVPYQMAQMTRTKKTELIIIKHPTS